MADTARFLTRMLLFLLAGAVIIALLYSTLLEAFMSNALLNGVILSVLVIGIFLNIQQVTMLRHEVLWLNSFKKKKRDNINHSFDKTNTNSDNFQSTKLLSSMALIFSESNIKGGKISLSAQAMKTLLDGIASRLQESRELSRYFIGLSIFLGLLGTFWGLLGTVASIGDVIRNLSISGEDITLVFDELKSGLEAPLDGMGTAFSSSLFGLAGSLVLGFLDLQAGQAQNSFYNDLEEWLSSITRLSSGGEIRDGEQNISAYTEALLDQTAESLDELQRILTKSEENRIATNEHYVKMNENLSMLTEQMRTEQQILLKVATNQKDLLPLLNKITEVAEALKVSSESLMDERTKNSIKNIDQSLNRLTIELASRHDQFNKDIRSEIKLLAKTVAASSERSDSQD